jgi:hypothetical protein
VRFLGALVDYLAREDAAWRPIDVAPMSAEIR